MEKKSEKTCLTNYTLLIAQDGSLSNLVDNLAEGTHKIICNDM